MDRDVLYDLANWSLFAHRAGAIFKERMLIENEDTNQEAAA